MIAMLTYGGIPKPGDVVPDFHELELEMKALGLTSAAKQLDRTWTAFQTTGTPRTELLALMNETYIRIMDDLETQVFLTIPYKDKDLYDGQEPIFGQQVEAAFENSCEDISEAGKCVALGRYTAAVFHLMRAMEASVQCIGNALSVAIVDKNNKDLAWGPILANVKKIVEVMPNGTKKTSWLEICTTLYLVKQAWRNETMHPKKTYTEEEARMVFYATRAFMKTLACQL